MTEIIQAISLGYGNQVQDASFTVATGSLTAIVTANEESNLALTRLILGLARPDSGVMRVLGQDLGLLSGRDLLQMRQRIGVVYSTGGLISNLKVLENLMLPLLYHTSLPREAILERGRVLLDKLEYRGNLMDLPGLLTTYQKRLLGCARAMLVEPEIIIYESPYLGLTNQERRFLLNKAVDFHHAMPGRTSLFITSNPSILALLEDVRVCNLTKGSP